MAIVAFLFGIQAVARGDTHAHADAGQPPAGRGSVGPGFPFGRFASPPSRPNGERGDPIRDLDQVRQFFATPGPAALFDLPWTPLYLVVCFLFHPWLGWLTHVRRADRVGAGAVGEVRSRASSERIAQMAAQRQRAVDGARRNAEVLATMNLRAPLRAAVRSLHRANISPIVQKGSDGATGDQRRRACAADAAAVAGAGAGGLSRHPPGDFRRYDHRDLDTRVARAGADRHCGLAMAAVRRRAPGRRAPRSGRLPTPMPHEPGTRLPTPRSRLEVEAGFIAPPGARVATVSGISPCAGGRRRAGHHRAVRLRQDDAGARDHRRLAAGTRRGHARRRPARPVLRRGPRRGDRLSAAGRRAVRRHDRREHRPLRAGPRRRSGACGPRSSPTCTT